MDLVRVVGATEPVIRAAAAALGVYVAGDPVVGNGRLELRHYVREQAVSRTLHRFGNLVT